VDFSGLGNVSIYPRAGANPVLEHSKVDFYDSIYHGRALVGVNTSAMIEAGIVGRPVLTILAPEFKGTQEGTLHCYHLIEGGLLRPSESLEEHLSQLSDVLTGAFDADKVRRFIESFVRPCGLERESPPYSSTPSRNSRPRFRRPRNLRPGGPASRGNPSPSPGSSWRCRE
jgi:hypothetical protein